MVYFLSVFIIILIIIVIILLVKLHLIRKSAREIQETLAGILSTDTNILITISSRDPYMRRLAESLNYQLRALRRERHRFRQGDWELKESVTNISHDLRTPLTAICGYLDLLEQEEKSPEAARYLDIIGERIQAMKQLTEELFRYTVFVSNEEIPSLEEVCMNRVLEESIAAYYGALKGCGITPDISMPQEPVIRTLNANALSRIFSNLLSNAIKYSDGDLHITLTAAGEVRFTNKASRLDEIQVGRLFDRYYTVENASPSTGLGLSIARLLTDQLHGQISADYQDGSLCIRLVFPRSA